MDESGRNMVRQILRTAEPPSQPVSLAGGGAVLEDDRLKAFQEHLKDLRTRFEETGSLEFLWQGLSMLAERDQVLRSLAQLQGERSRESD